MILKSNICTYPRFQTTFVVYIQRTQIYITRNNQAQWSFVKHGDWIKAIWSYVIMCFHPFMSLNNEKICFEISKDEIAVCEKTAGQRRGKFSNLNSAYQKV